MTNDQRMDFIEGHAKQMMEHFDSIRVFATLHGDDNNTLTFTLGAGNFYSQLGQIKEWMEVQDQSAREHAKNKG